MNKFVINGCSTCPFLLVFDESEDTETAFCRMSVNETGEITKDVQIDLGLIEDDVAENCPIKDGMLFRLNEDLDQEVWSETEEEEKDEFVPFKYLDDRLDAEEGSETGSLEEE